MTVQEFKVSKDITLRLEGEETVLYIYGKRFIQCKYLLLQIPESEVSSFDEIDSIDEAQQKLDTSLHPTWDAETDTFERKRLIPPEVEFWGHCSNLQAWVENNYDTRLLHSNIAFPILHELAIGGDKEAEFKLKEEIAKRIESGHRNVINYLMFQGYFGYFTISELSDIFMGMIERNIDINLEESDFALLFDFYISHKNYKEFAFIIHILVYICKKGKVHVVRRFLTQIRREKRNIIRKMIQELSKEGDVSHISNFTSLLNLFL